MLGEGEGGKKFHVSFFILHAYDTPFSLFLEKISADSAVAEAHHLG